METTRPRRVVITGGAGFLGRGFLRRVAQGKLDWKVTVFSRDETKQDECRSRYSFPRYVLGDIRDYNHLLSAFIGADLVIHAAAMKYIPDAERNAGECISVNTFGTFNVINAAKDAGVPKVVGISTDKACQPVNVYGATKMIMERAFANEAVMRSDDNEQKTRFVCVRYGNVIGSTGSVIPLFDRQMRDKGKVTLTSPRMTRFWMSIEEAIDLVLRAADAEDSNGSIFVPLARAMSMLDVALAIAGEPAKIEEIGMRPGEKMDEQLIHYAESLRVRRHDDCFELLPITAEAGTESFTLASHSPNHWMTTEELLNAVEDAREV